MTEGDQDRAVGAMFRQAREERRKLACLRNRAAELADKLSDAAAVLAEHADADVDPADLGGPNPYPDSAELVEVCEAIAASHAKLTVLEGRKRELGY